MIQNIASERAVLSCIAQHGDPAFVEVYDIVNTNTFTNELNQILWKCFENLFSQGKKVDTISLFSSAEELGLGSYLQKKQSADYIHSIFTLPIKVENIREQHALPIARLEFARKAQASHIETADKLSDITGRESLEQILAVSEGAVFGLFDDLGVGDKPTKKFGDFSVELLDYAINNPVDVVGVPTPWQYFNKAIGGGIRTGVALVGARPKIGKSSFAVNCGLFVSQRIPVLYIDTEMEFEEQMWRLIASLSGVPIKNIETGKFDAEEQVDLSKNAAKLIEQYQFHHRTVKGMNFPEILSIIRRWIYQEVGFNDEGKANPCLILYDYFKLMGADILKDMQEYQALGFQISTLSDFCGKYNIPCLAFVQLNRDGINKETTDVISQSDRLLWLCTSFSIFKRKTSEEINEEGKNKGNRKLIPIETRFGGEWNSEDWINMEVQGHVCKISELGTHFGDIQANTTLLREDIDETTV